jgi:hypothetical protein
MNETILTLLLYGIVAFAITSIVYALTMFLGIYSILLLLVLSASTMVSLDKLAKRDDARFYDRLFIPVLVFVIVSIVLAFFTSWMFWVVIPALMYVLFLNTTETEAETDEVTKTVKKIVEMSKTIQGKQSSWENPFAPFTRDSIRTLYAFSLCALYICTTMVITPLWLPVYTPLIIWAIVLIILILAIRREETIIFLRRLKKLKRE